jgi:hypothetical protein
MEEPLAGSSYTCGRFKITRVLGMITGMSRYSAYSWAITRRGETYLEMERYDEVLADFDYAIELAPDGDAWPTDPVARRTGGWAVWARRWPTSTALSNSTQATSPPGTEARGTAAPRPRGHYCRPGATAKP